MADVSKGIANGAKRFAFFNTFSPRKSLLKVPLPGRYCFPSKSNSLTSPDPAGLGLVKLSYVKILPPCGKFSRQTFPPELVAVVLHWVA